MPRHTLAQLQDWTAGECYQARVRTEIEGFCIDSRNLRTRQIFVALKTASRDGHAFIREAWESGAAAALVENVAKHVPMPQLRVPDTLRALHTIAAQHRRSFNGPLVAITGSCGKTSTKDLLRRLLGNATTHATQGNYNNHLGVPLTLLSIDPKKHRTSIIEIGMNAPGEIAPLTNLTVPQIGIVTGIAPVHLQGLGSLERIADEKAEMLHRLPRKGNALFPLDCLQYPAFRKIVAPARILAPRGKPLPQGLNAEQVIDYWSWETSQKETRIGIAARKASPTATPQYFTVSFQGPGMVRNTALAIITASTLGISDQDIQKRLAGWQPSPLRGEIVQKGRNVLV